MTQSVLTSYLWTPPSFYISTSSLSLSFFLSFFLFSPPLHDVQLVIEEEQKFLKLLEILGHYQEKGSVIIFVDKQEHADALLKDLMKASYPCMSLHGGLPRVRGSYIPLWGPTS